MKKKNDTYTTKNILLAPIFLRTMEHAGPRRAFYRYMKTIVCNFFLLQFAVKFGFKKIQILNVDHPLDKTVPFTPEKVSVYLNFVAFWIKPLGYIGHRYGLKTQLAYTVKFLNLVDLCYRDATEVYRFRMTTTKRPKYRKGKFLTIHLFDPHYMCVPSLHIMVVVLAYTFYRKTFAELGMPKEEAEVLNTELYNGAVEIAETVLYIKQHSVNCIPAALYAISRILPDEVTPTEVMRFINSLFAHTDSISQENIEKIRTHIADMYEVLFLEGCHDSTWITPLQRWLNSYSLAGFIN